MGLTDDLVEIHQSAALYAHVIDAADWARLGDVFCLDGKLNNAQGHASIVEFLSKVRRPMVHHATNLFITLGANAGEATAVSKYLVIWEDHSIAAGTYNDVWVRESAGWRIKERITNTVVSTTKARQ